MISTFSRQPMVFDKRFYKIIAHNKIFLGNSLTDELLKENSRDNSQLMDSLLEAMRKQKVKSSSANGVYELSLEKYKDYKTEKEKAAKDKEINDLKVKLEKAENQTKKIPKLESRVTKLETELTDLRNLLKEMVGSNILHIICSILYAA